MKKLIALLLALLMVFSMVACAAKEEAPAADAPATDAPATDAPATDAPATDAPSAEGLTYIEGTKLLDGKPFDGTTLNYCISSPGDAQYENQKIYTEKEFTPMTGITANWDMGAYAEMYAKELTEAVSGSTTYDLFQVNDTWGPALRNYMTPLDDYIARDGIDLSEWSDTLLEVGMMGGDGTIYGLPIRGHFQIVFYRADVYEELGLEIPETWDELIANCKTIQEETDLWGMAMPYGINGEQNLMPWYSFFYSHGGEFFDENMKPTFNSEAGVKSLEMYVGLMNDEGICSPDCATAFENDCMVQLATGTAAHVMTWSWTFQKLLNPEFVSEDLLGKFSYFPVPSYDGTTPAQIATTCWSVGIPASSQNPDAAWEYIKYLTSVETEYKVVTDKTEYDTVQTLHNSNLSNPEVIEATGGVMAYGVEGYKSSRLPPLFDDWMTVSAILEVCVNNCANGADIQAELDAAAAEAEAALDNLGYYD